MKIKNLFFLSFIIFLLSISSIIAYAADETCVGEELCSANISGLLDNTDQGELDKLTEHDESKICIVYFYGRECSKCAKLKPYLKDIEERYKDDISITYYEIYHNLKNYQLYNDFCNIKSIDINDRGVPFVAIDDEYYMGLEIIKDKLEPKIKDMIESGKRVCPLEGEMACHKIDYNKSGINPSILNFDQGITLPLVIGAGLIDGINPCAFAVLLFLITFLISVSSKRKRMIKAGAAYITAVYITYLLAGIGLLSVIQISGLSGIIVKIAAAIAIITGLINLKDFFWYGKGVTLRIPRSKKKTIEKWTKRANIPAALVLGFLVSCDIGAPCRFCYKSKSFYLSYDL